MARLTEEMVVARSKQSDLTSIKKLNCWGAELGDVSLLRRMPNVEVLALSINKITTLADFAYCPRLRELYVRKNNIRDLAEIRHLQGLLRLTSLWLDENPCTDNANYRMTVLRNLPNLQKLDNVMVQPEELQEAMRKGSPITDPDDDYYTQQEAYGQYRRPRSSDSSPEREEPPRRAPLDQGSDCSESAETYAEPATNGCRRSPPPPGLASSPPRRAGHSPEHEPAPAHPHPAHRPHYYDRSPPEEAPDPAPAIRHSQSAHSVKYSGSAGDPGSRYQLSSPQYSRHSADLSHSHYHPAYGADRSEGYQQVPRGEEREREGVRRERDGEIPSAVMAEHRGFTRRPVTRNSNLLSAVLCLVKELDYPSLEVAEMAVRCRMDELASRP